MNVEWTDSQLDQNGERWIRGVSTDGQYRHDVKHEMSHGYYTARIEKLVEGQTFTILISRYTALTMPDARAWCEMMSDWLAAEVRHGNRTED